jgi:hypothetical protein
MTKYDSRFDPPAPVALCSCRNPTTNQIIANVPLLVDTGADVTLLPRESVQQVGIEALPNEKYELAGFDGQPSSAPIVFLDVVFENRAYRGKYVVIDDEIGILGRDVLNFAVLRLDGPRQEWTLV